MKRTLYRPEDDKSFVDVLIWTFADIMAREKFADIDKRNQTLRQSSLIRADFK
jgi:hypothetical protein